MTGTRNPSRKYFKRNQPYFYKSADNWEEWDTDESYDRTFFIGIDDSNPEDIDVALYMIWGGRPVAVVGDKVLDTISGVVETAEQLETEIQSVLEEVQELAAAVAQSQIDIEEAITEMNALVDRCEGILDGAEAARDLARDWATKMDGQVEVEGEPVDYSAKYYANEAGNSATSAAGSASAASGDADLAEAWASKTDGTVGDTNEYSAKHYASAASDIYTALVSNTDVATVSANIASVNAVAGISSAVSTVANKIAEVDTVAWISNDVTTVAGIATAVSNVSNIESDVLDVSDNRTDISTVASNISNVNTVAGNSTAVSTVAANDANVTTVATNISDVNTAATNIAAIQAAPTAASNAASSATLAQDWATKMDGQVASTDYSSKYYAGQSANSANYAAGIEANIHSIVDDAAQTLSKRLNTPFFFGQSMYSENAPYNASWLASNGTYNSSAVYPDMYTQLNSVELNGSLNVGDTIEIDGKTYVKRGLSVVLSTGTITDFDFVVNQNDQTFRLPLLNGEENIPDYEHKINSVITGTINSTGQTYTAPKSGLFYHQVSIEGVNAIAVAVNGITVESLYEGSGILNYSTGFLTEVRKGDIIKLFVGYGSGTGIVEDCWLAPYKGNGTLYYYVGDTVQDASLINAGAVLGQLTNKANVDASNFNAAGKSTIVSLCVPDYNAGSDVTASVFASSGTGYQPTKDGVLFVWGKVIVSTGISIYVYNSEGTQVANLVLGIEDSSSQASGSLRSIPVNKNFSYRCYSAPAGCSATFFPYVGV